MRAPILFRPGSRRAGLKRGTLASALLAALLLAAPVAAQQRSEVKGRVLDRNTGKPVAGAVVSVEREGRSAVADEQGAFSLGRLRPGSLELSVRALGYETGTHSLRAEGGEVADVTLAMTPNPVLLEGLRVMSDRFQDRRTAYPRAVQVLDNRELALSTHNDMSQLLRARLGLRPTTCASGISGGTESCILSRGRPAPMAVYVDEVRSPGGMSLLELYRPDEVEMVEVYANGREVRIYTASFMEWAARSRFLPIPIGI